MRAMKCSIFVAFFALHSRAVTSHEVVANGLRGSPKTEEIFEVSVKNEVAHISTAMNTDGKQRAGRLEVLQSGVQVSDEVISSFNKLKLTRELRYLMYIIKDKTIVLEKHGERSMTYDDFVKELPERDCRYGVIDIEYVTDDGRSMSKIVLISWIPDNATVRNRMLYSSAMQNLRRYLSGVTEIIASDQSDLDEASIVAWLKKV
jgi:cofilin